jgi:hypothetical protein
LRTIFRIDCHVTITHLNISPTTNINNLTNVIVNSNFIDSKIRESLKTSNRSKKPNLSKTIKRYIDCGRIIFHILGL